MVKNVKGIMEFMAIMFISCSNLKDTDLMFSFAAIYGLFNEEDTSFAVDVCISYLHKEWNT